MKLPVRLLLPLLLLLITADVHAGGPWLLKKGTGFAQAQAVIPGYRYTRMLNGFSLRDYTGVNRATLNADFGLYAEYGLTDKIDVIAHLPFKYIDTGEQTDSLYFEDLLDPGTLTGLSNTMLAFKFGLVDSKVKVAASLVTQWNTARFDQAKGLATGFDANSFGAVVHVGRGTEKHYGFLEVGFHAYTNNFSDVVTVRAEHGWAVGQRANVGALLDVRQSLENGTYRNANIEQTGLYPNDQSWVVISAKASYEWDSGTGVNAAVPLVPIQFKNVGYNGAVALGVYRKF